MARRKAKSDVGTDPFMDGILGGKSDEATTDPGAPARAELHVEHGDVHPGSIVVGDWYWLRLEEEDADDESDLDDEDEFDEEDEDEDEDEDDGEHEDLTENDDEDMGTWKSEHEDGLVRRANGELRFVCVTDLGSNYAKVEDVYGHSWRVHFGHFLRTCEAERDPDTVISGKIAATRKNIQAALGAVHEIHRRLGLAQTRAAQAAETTGLAVLSGHVDPKAHSTALAKARDEDLPALYQTMKEQNSEMVRWLAARAIPYRAMAEGLNETVAEINDKVFNIELYAGLVETTELIKKGKPAPLGTKLHLMQRMHYMDEECLLDYEAGGMDFKKIRAFDRWLSKPGNFERILPHPRCMIAMRVRRYAVQRDYSRKYTMSDFMRFGEEDRANKWTFLYVRNGERLSCLETQIKFQEKLFPDLDRSRNIGSEALYMNTRSHEVIPEARYDTMVVTFRKNEKDYNERHAQWIIDVGAWDLLWKPQLELWEAECDALDEKYEEARTAYRATLDEEDAEWFDQFSHARHGREDHPKRQDHPRKPDAPDRPREPYDNPTHPSCNWVPFDTSTVNYDDAVEKIEREIQEHNRVALIVQGLFDRTDILHPHGPVRLWDVAGFDEAVELVYDTDRALTDGSAPDIDAYFAGLRTSIAPGSFTLGQERAWLSKMADKENDRRSRRRGDAGDADDEELETFRPAGNPGPGIIASVLSMRGGKCRYEWQREREFRSYRRASIILDDAFLCPTETLFHVSAYAPGDYKQFFADPRTRAQYLQWAPMLLRAEDWHAEHAVAPLVVTAERKPMTLRHLIDRKMGDPIFVRRTTVLTTKAGKPRKRGPAQEVTEGVVKFRWHTTSGRPAGRGRHWVDVYEVKLTDDIDLSIKREQTWNHHEKGAHVFVQDDVTYEFFWPNRAENAAHKTPQRRRRRKI